MIAVPLAANQNDSRSIPGRSVDVLRLQKAAEIASSQIITESVTWITSATRKKSRNGMNSCTTGVRASTSRIEKTPAATSDMSPRVSQAVVDRAAAGLRIGRSKLISDMCFHRSWLNAANYRPRYVVVNARTAAAPCY